MPSGMRTAIDLLAAGTVARSLVSSIDLKLQSPRLQPTFSFRRPSPALCGIRVDRSTGSKQTLNGLFICMPFTLCVKRFTKFFPSLLSEERT